MNKRKPPFAMMASQKEQLIEDFNTMRHSHLEMLAELKASVQVVDAMLAENNTADARKGLSMIVDMLSEKISKGKETSNAIEAMLDS